jgi:hypothetical protein
MGRRCGDQRCLPYYEGWRRQVRREMELIHCEWVFLLFKAVG